MCICVSADGNEMPEYRVYSWTIGVHMISGEKLSVHRTVPNSNNAPMKLPKARLCQDEEFRGPTGAARSHAQETSRARQDAASKPWRVTGRPQPSVWGIPPVQLHPHQHLQCLVTLHHLVPPAVYLQTPDEWI